MKTAVVAIVALMLTVALSAQSQERFTVVAGAGIGSYKMTALKDQHDESVSSFPLLKSVSNYPAYLYYSAEVYVRLSKVMSLGVVYRLQSTGSRASYSDYSGSLIMERLIHSNNIGLAAEFNVWSADKFSLSAQLRTYYGFTKLTIDNRLELGPEWVSTPYHVESSGTSILINPDVTASYNVWDRLYLNVQAGYAVDFKGMVNVMEPPGASQIQFDWSGVRVGISAAYKF